MSGVLDPGFLHTPEPVALAVQNIGEGPHGGQFGLQRTVFQQRRAHRLGGHVGVRPGRAQVRLRLAVGVHDAADVRQQLRVLLFTLGLAPLR